VLTRDRPCPDAADPHARLALDVLALVQGRRPVGRPGRPRRRPGGGVRRDRPFLSRVRLLQPVARPRHKYADKLHAIHIGSGQKLTFFNGERAWDLTGGRPIPDGLPAEVHAAIVAMERRFAVHLAAHMLAPSTLAYGLTDSPAGMLAWILERWVNWSDNGGDIETVFSKDDLLTHAMIFWVTNSIGTSIRTYANNNRYPWTPAHHRQP
jgi:hypothetical protein